MSWDYDTYPGLGRDRFGTVELGDRRRIARLVMTFDRISMHLGGTLPEGLASPPDLRGLDRLCESDPMTHEAAVHSHRSHAEMLRYGCLLALRLVEQREA